MNTLNAQCVMTSPLVVDRMARSNNIQQTPKRVRIAAPERSGSLPLADAASDDSIRSYHLLLSDPAPYRRARLSNFPAPMCIIHVAL